MLQFPYLEEPLTGPVPHSLSASSSCLFRPLIPLTVAGPSHRVIFNRAVLDTGSDDTILPLDCLLLTEAVPLPDRGQRIVWGGKRYHLQYARVILFLADSTTYSWPATVAFSAAPLNYPVRNGLLS
ncbi:hypothetical protein BH10PLA2_BH10PLA2_28900 [soil metagenome]